LTLTDIYLRTHQYQSIVREITTPTLPIFVSSCLALVSSKSAKAIDAPASLLEAIFEAFSVLIPRHPTIFRPFATQIRNATRPYVAPTSSDGRFVSISLQESARSLSVVLHQTAPKNTSGEEWGKNVRELVKEIHETTDQLFRAVVEDWESSVGYISQPANVNEELHGGGKSNDDYPVWNGIDAGLERLGGLLAYLEDHFKHHTATAVTAPLGIIDDLLARLMSIAPPNSKGPSDYGSMRLHPAVERDEREGLWTGLPQIHISVMQVYSVLISRLQQSFTSLASGCLEHITWTFPASRSDDTFRCLSYEVARQLLLHCGLSLPKSAVDRLVPILLACCKELRPEEESIPAITRKDSNGKVSANSSANADMFLQNKSSSLNPNLKESDVLRAASELLPLFFSYLPQQNLDGYRRAELERTAILARHKEAMLASVLNPFIGKNGRSLPSILPYLCRAFPGDSAVEALLRPRMPVIRQAGPLMSGDFEEPIEEEDLVMEDLPEQTIVTEPKVESFNSFKSSTQQPSVAIKESSSVEPLVDNDFAWGSASTRPGTAQKVNQTSTSVDANQATTFISNGSNAQPTKNVTVPSKSASIGNTDGGESDSDSGESVHLNMDLSDSEDEA
jgi:pre-rRNA-processing protein RIX1